MTPSNKFNKPVIGKITTISLSAEMKISGQIEKTVFPSDTYEVIDIVKTHSGSTVYICNSWYKTDVVQLVPDCLVAKFNPISI